MLKIISFLITALLLGFLVYTNTQKDFNFNKFRESSGYSTQVKLSKKLSKSPSPLIKSTDQLYSVKVRKEYIPNDKVIKSCNLILKSKLSLFKQFSTFLSSPCLEIASQKVTFTKLQNGDSLNWVQFYQKVNENYDSLNRDEQNKLKDKIITQLANAGNLLQTRILGDILGTILLKERSVKAQELERLNSEMASEIQLIHHETIGLPENDPYFNKIRNQERDTVKRFTKQFKNIMDLE